MTVDQRRHVIGQEREERQLSESFDRQRLAASLLTRQEIVDLVSDLIGTDFNDRTEKANFQDRQRWLARLRSAIDKGWWAAILGGLGWFANWFFGQHFK